MVTDKPQITSKEIQEHLAAAERVERVNNDRIAFCWRVGFIVYVYKTLENHSGFS